MSSIFKNIKTFILWEFHWCIMHIAWTHPLPTSASSSPWVPPAHPLPALVQFLPAVRLVLPICTWVCDLLQERGQLLLATPSKKNDYPSPHSHHHSCSLVSFSSVSNYLFLYLSSHSSPILTTNKHFFQYKVCWWVSLLLTDSLAVPWPNSFQNKKVRPHPSPLPDKWPATSYFKDQG